MVVRFSKHTIIILLAIVVTACKKGKRNPNACNGDTRRELKVLIDNSVDAINFASKPITLTALGDLEVPEVNTETPRQSVELQLYTVTAKVDKVDKKFDGDYHVRLKEGDRYLIAECPNPGCSYAQQSKYLNNYNEVRYFIENNDLEGKMVTITGVAFVDIDHHYKRKQAPNNIELHPIIAIHY